MKAVLLQLPVPGFLWPSVDANIPLAAGYLASWMGASGRAQGWDIEILPWQEVDLLGDEALLRAIASRRPDLVGFSAYLWNVERSAWLASRLSDAGVTVLLGGPEVLPDNAWLWEEGGFAAGVPGEGEEPFARVLGALACGSPLEDIPGLLLGPRGRSTGPSSPCIDLAALPSPYLSGLLAPSPDGAVWLETVRGCAFRCAYCHYGKRYERPQAFPPGWLERHLTWARARQAREVYLMDPSFNVRPDWESLLRVLERGNPDRTLALHTELVADALRSGDARRLARAGLRSCEVGLQSVRPEVLAAVGRRWNRERWLRGVGELLAEGVSVTVGLIVGLPADDPSGFEETLDFVLGEATGAEVQVFPLALLPGTDLRARAESLGFSYLWRPPYTVTRTKGYGPDALAAAFDRFEEATDLELDALEEPALAGAWDSDGEGVPHLSGVRLDARTAPPDWVERIAPRAARNLTVWVRGWKEVIPREIATLAGRLPYGVLTVVLDDEPGWPVERLNALLSIVGTGDHYLDRYFRHLYGAGARLVPRLVTVVPDGHPAATPRWMESIAKRAELVWSVTTRPGWQQTVSRRAGRGEWSYVQGEVPDGPVLELIAELGEDAAWVLFAWPGAEALRSRSLGRAGFRAPDHRLCMS